MTQGVPLALSQNLKHNGIMHEKVLLVAVETLEVPRVSEAERFRVSPISDGISRIELRFGFIERPDVPKGLETALRYGQIANCDHGTATYYTGHETIIPAGRRPGMARWRERCLGSCTAMRSAQALISIFPTTRLWK
jgi:KUP system potassium uptake protein